MIKADSALSQREVCVSKINQIEGIPMGVLCYMWHALRRVVLPAFRGCLSLEVGRGKNKGIQTVHACKFKNF